MARRKFERLGPGALEIGARRGLAIAAVTGGPWARRLAALTACVAGPLLLPALAPAAHRPIRPGRSAAPARYDVSFSLSGQYTYHYRAKAGPQSERLLHFEPTATYRRVPLYAKGRPPSARPHSLARHATALPELVGSWSISYVDPSGEDSCQAGDVLSPNPAPGPALTATYRRHGYSLAIEAAAGLRPFLFSSTEIGGPCGVSDPWSEWVVRGGVPNGGADILSASVSLSQRRLRAVEGGRKLRIPVSLSPSEGFPSEDCGTATSLEVSCTQRIEWSGDVTVRRGASR